MDNDDFEHIGPQYRDRKGAMDRRDDEREVIEVARDLVEAQAEIARLRLLGGMMADEADRQKAIVEQVRQILNECEEDFHVCDRCGHQDDEATKSSNLYLLLRDVKF